MIYSFFLLSFCLTSPLVASSATNMTEIVPIFQSSPLIYGLLLTLSFASFFLVTYAFLSLSKRSLLPEIWIEKVRSSILEEKNTRTKTLLKEKNTPLAAIVLSGFKHQTLGNEAVLSSMQAQMQRVTALFWQPISLLYDIANVATMLGLLGTIVGIFQGLYDAKNNMEAIFTLFDGLAIAIGTTIAGLTLAMVSTLFAALLKWRTTAIMTQIEETALDIATLFKYEK